MSLWPFASAVGISDAAKCGIQDPGLARIVFHKCNAEGTQ